MADLLLLNRVVSVSMDLKISVRKRRSQMASLAACVCATYSASAVDNVTNSYFLEDQDTAPPSTIKK